MGLLCARCNLGSDHSPRSITPVTDLGLLGAAIYRAILDQHSQRSHPNKTADAAISGRIGDWTRASDHLELVHLDETELLGTSASHNGC